MARSERSLPSRFARSLLPALALVRVQSTLHEKAVQLTLTGLGLTLASQKSSPQLLDLDLLVFALPPLGAFLALRAAPGVSCGFLNKKRLLIALSLQSLFLLGAAQFVHLQQLAPALACFLAFTFPSVWMDGALIFSGRAGEREPHRFLRWLVPAAIALGSLCGGEFFRLLEKHHGAWAAAGWILSGVFLLSLIPICSVALVKPSAGPGVPSRAAPPEDDLVSSLRKLFADRERRLASLGVAFFWFAATASSVILIFGARESHGPGPAGLVLAAQLIACGCVGILLGAGAVSLYSRPGLELDLVPAAAVGLALAFLLAVFSGFGSLCFAAAIVWLGFSGGVLSVSLQVFLRQKSEASGHWPSAPGLAWLIAAAQLFALLFEWTLRAIHLSPRLHFALLGLLSAAAMIFIVRIMPRHFLRFFFTALVRLIYRIDSLNTRHVPREGGALMISNHVSYVDAFLLSAASPRPVRFVIVNHFLEVPAFGWFLRLFDVIPISPTRAKEAIRTTAEALVRGDLVCIFPEGQLTRTGMLNELKKGFELIVRQANCPVLPVYMDSVWGSIFSFERFRYFFKRPRRWPYPVTVNFGQPVPPDEINSSKARRLIQDLSVEAFARRRDLDMGLPAAAVLGLRQHGSADLFMDLGQNLRQLTRREALCTSLALAAHWRDQLPRVPQRIGIVLPPGSMPALLHLSAVLAGHVPVHLPLSYLDPSPERDNLLARHGIKLVLSSSALFPERAMPPGWIDLRKAVSAITLWQKFLARASQRFLPASLTLHFHRLHRMRGDAEAVAYVDEDTGGLVSLSHRNVLAAVHQMDSTLVLLPGERILVDQPFTSIASLVFGLWYPCLKRNGVLFRSLSARRIDPAFILRDRKPEAVLLSPALLGQLLASAEALPSSIRIFLDFFSQQAPREGIARLESAGATYCLGYAPSSLAAIVSMNTSDPNSIIPHHLPQTGNLPGTRGRLMPGLSALLLSPDGTPLEPGEDTRGRLAIRGVSLSGKPNLMIDGQPYHDTGAWASFDRLGFLRLFDSAGDEPPASSPPPGQS